MRTSRIYLEARLAQIRKRRRKTFIERRVLRPHPGRKR
jgi:hypothetical protein